MDLSLRNRLWDAFTTCYWTGLRYDTLAQNTVADGLCRQIWHNHFKKPIDTIPLGTWDAYQQLRKDFFRFAWYEVYDFLEFVAENYRDSHGNTTNKAFRDFCNSILESEMSAYRFVSGTLTQITGPEEVAAIEQATASPIGTVAVHLQRALQLLSSKQNPDYRNSIKESISAVEALCQKVSGEAKATLGDAIEAMKGKASFHPALIKAFGILYGYTSDAQGIRHALSAESHLAQEDAMFMLVSCSAFINYVGEKCRAASIAL